MNKLVLQQWRVLGGLLLTLILPLSRGAELPADNPRMGDSLTRPDAFPSETAAKRVKLEQNLKEAASEYQAANFENAVRWYESAVALDPIDKSGVGQALANARTMLNQQRKALAELPQNPKDRTRQLEAASHAADDLFKAQDYSKADKAYTKIWMTSGDFEGKTLKMLARCEEATAASRNAAPAVAVASEAAVPQVATSIASTDPQPALPTIPFLATSQPAPQAVMVADASPSPAPPPQTMALPPDTPSAQVPPATAQATPGPQATPIPPLDDVTRLTVTKYLHTAEQQMASGDKAGARTSVGKALLLWPDNPQARQMMDSLNKDNGVPVSSDVPTLLANGDALLSQHRPDSAMLSYKEVLRVDPQNAAAQSGLARAQQMQTELQKMGQMKGTLADRHEIDALQAEAERYYSNKQLARARETWQEILRREPGNKLAETWLEKTQDDNARLASDQKAQAAAEARDATKDKLLNSPITITTEDRRIPLSTFMYQLSFVTPVELEYYIAEGADAQVQANFVNKSLKDVLNTVLNDIGLSWSIDDTNVITIKPNLMTRTYVLSPDQMSKVKGLIDSGELQKLIWGQTDAPAKGDAITVDERQNVVMLTGSKLHVQKMTDYLDSIKLVQTPDLIMRTYKIREEDGPRIQALIKSIISSTGANRPFELERKALVDKDDLIIRDTPENVQKIEELLLDKNFISKLADLKLDIQNYSLVPQDLDNTNTDQVRVFTSRVVEAIKTFLYAKEGERKAAEEGRRLWFDESTLQLTVVDSPDNLTRVGEYIDSLPEIRKHSQQKVIFLQNAVAETMAASLESILNLTGGVAGAGAGGTAAGNEQVLRLNRGDEKTYRDPTGQSIQIRLVRTEPNNIQDLHDDSAELTIVTQTGVNNLTLRELDTQFINDYEFTAEQVRSSGGATNNTGNGTATIRVQYAPQQGQQLPAAVVAPITAAAIEDQGITINPFGDQNALIIRYSNPDLFKDVTDLIALLDKPTRQVSIETKFVQVNESRAKEASADLSIAGLGSGRSIDWGSQTINTSFAQDIDEFRSAFEPPIEDPLSANLLKGTTAISAVIGSFPGISYSLNLLEAEGIVNVINGPKVTALDGQEAEFRIEGISSTAAAPAAAANGTVTITNALPTGTTGFQLTDPGGGGGGTTGLNSAVVLRVTPEITSEKSILLSPLEAELLDFEGYAANTAQPVVTAIANPNQSVATPILPPVALTNYPLVPLQTHKFIRTNARIANGGTIIIGGWTGEQSQDLTSGIPVLRNMPYIGKLLFSREQRSRDRTTLLIFLSAGLVD